MFILYVKYIHKMIPATESKSSAGSRARCRRWHPVGKPLLPVEVCGRWGPARLGSRLRALCSLR